MIAIIVIAFIAIAIVGAIVTSTNKQNALEQWAADNQYELVSVERRAFAKGPYFFSGKDKTVYYVTVQSNTGDTRNAYVRVGNFLPGLPYNVDVSWD